jgi:hypothetical protein
MLVNRTKIILLVVTISLILQTACAVSSGSDKQIRRGDVLMRSLRVWPKDDGDERNTLQAAKDFKVDKIVWIYENTEDYNKKVRSEGIGIGSTMAANARERWFDKFSQEQKEEFVDKFTIRNLKGQQVIAEHMKHFGSSAYITHFQPDVAIDEWVDYYTKYVTYLYGLSIDTIHRDDPAANWWAPRCGGTFTDASVEYFRQYLEDNFNTSELKKMGVEDVKNFNVREHFLKLGAPTDNSLWQWRGSPLMSVYFDAMEKVTVDFYKEVRGRVEKTTGIEIPWSLNGVGPYSDLDRVFDFRIGEFQRHHNQPQTLLLMSRYAAGENKLQALISMVDGNWPDHPEQFVSETRKHIATAYATGMIPLVPWCMYMHQAPRYYGQVDDFGDLFHLVAENRELFDGYTLEAANGIDTNANLYSLPVNKEMNYPEENEAVKFWIDRENIFAFLRCNEANAPKVVHLIDWNESAEPFTLSFSPGDVTGSKAADISLITSGGRKREIKNYSGQDLEIEAISPWAIMVVTASQKQQQVIAPKVISPARRVTPAGTKIILEAADKETAVMYRLTDQNFKKYDKNDPPVVKDSGTLEAFCIRTSDKQRSEPVKIHFETYQDYAVDMDTISKMKPAAKLENSFRLVKGKMKVNESFLGKGFRMGEKDVDRGVATQGHTLLTTAVDPSWKYFSVKAGVDDAEDRRPCLRFQVWFDNDIAYETPIFNPTKLVIMESERRVFPIALKIPEDVSQIRLVTIPGGFFDEQNNAVWAEPTAY